MKNKFLVILLAAAVIVPIALFGCKGKVDKPIEEPRLDSIDTMSPIPMESMTSAQQAAQNVMMEPAQNIASEPIPATAAAPGIAQNSVYTATKIAFDRNKEIQKALKAAGFYTGLIDGKIGPRTKKAILDFQRANGLKVDGKVGPKTFAALEKYLIQE